jgi:hypothetical protein
MNKRIEELAKQAGFCFWTDESWKPEGATIDWSCNYDDQLQKFAELVVKDCMKLNVQLISINAVERLLPLYESLYEEHFGKNND